MPSSKRTRASEDHEASGLNAQAKRVRNHGPLLPDIVPPIAPRHTPNSSSSKPHTNVSTIERQKPHNTVRPASSCTMKLRIRKEDGTASDAQTANPLPVATSSRTAISSCSDASASHTGDKSAACNVESIYGPTSTRTAHSETSASSIAPQDGQTTISRWNSTPFTLVTVGDKLCPRLDVSSEHGLYRILDEGQHPIGTAIAKIHQYGRTHGSIPCEARRVLRMFDAIHRGCPSSPYITLLDPLLYASSATHTQPQLECFRRKEWGWLVRVGTQLPGSDLFHEAWDLVAVKANYKRLEIALTLSRDEHTVVFIPGPSIDDPPKSDVIQLYTGSSHKPCSPMPRALNLSALRDIAFCQYWIPTFNSEDVCAVIKYRCVQPALTPQHIDIIVRDLFKGEYPYLMSWVTKLTALDKANRKAGIMEVRYHASISHST